VARPTSLGLDELRALGPAVTRTVTLECAGNGRTLLRPGVSGTPWTLGATSTAHFTGLPLLRLLEAVGAAPAAAEVLFTGADGGRVDGWGEISFQRSLPSEAAFGQRDGPILAWAMNGAPLRPEHGAPLRLVVPGWYAVASVKWLAALDVLDEPFHGYFQTDRYRYLRPGAEPEPVRRMRVRSLILEPSPGGAGDGSEAVARVHAGRVRVTGIAWSGHGKVEGVRVSVDGGERWQEAELAPAGPAHTARRWSLAWEATPGSHELVARARDTEGNEQPLEPWWNEQGYGNNVVHRVRVRVSGGSHLG
jgi:DMSO/TMAO reductase YedYZ molybdopterin-dependent catalytic subunit